MSATGLIAGARIGLGRGLRLQALGWALLALCLVALGAFAERRAGLLGAANRALTGSAFGLVIPLYLFATATTVLGGARLDHAASPIARFGHPRRRVALGLVLGTMLLGGLAAAVLGATAALVAHDPSAPPTATDALTAAWIGALTGCAYGGLFALGSTFGARGGGRIVALLLDFLLGSTSGAAALFFPRAHAQNLLGAEPPLQLLTQPTSTACLAVLAVVLPAIALLRCPR